MHQRGRVSRLDTRVAISEDEREQDPITITQMCGSDSNKTTPTGYIDDTSPCSPGPSETSPYETYKTSISSNNAPHLPRIPSFTELNSWLTKTFPVDNEEMEPIYLPDDSPLKGKDKALWQKREELVDMGPLEYYRGDFPPNRHTLKRMERSFNDERIRRYLGYRPHRRIDAEEEHYSRDDKYDRRRGFVYIVPSTRIRDYEMQVDR
jgi:hypothetical protein